MSPGAQNLKTRPNALRTVKKDSGRPKHENWTRRPRYRQKLVWERKTLKRDLTPSVPPKMSQGAQNMKTGHDALGTAEDESGRAKYENGTRLPQNRRNRVRARKTIKRDPTPPISPKTSLRAQNMKTGPDTLGTAENESGRATH
jgi:hypothetical protein